MRMLVLLALAVPACAHGTPRAQAPVELALGRQDEAYLAADEIRTLSLESPGGPLLVSCGITGEGSYARVEVHQGADLLGKGGCGDRIRIADAPAGPLTLTVRAFGNPGSLRLLADRAPPEPLAVDPRAGDPPEAELAAALKSRDEAALDALLMDDFSASMAGETLDKRAFVAAAGRDPAEAEPKDVRARIHGQTAAVTLTLGSRAVTDTWVLDGGRWRLLARQR